MKRVPLRSRLTGLAILLVLLPLFSVGLCSHFLVSESINTLSEKHVVNIARDLAGMIQAVISGQARSVRQLSVSQSVIAACARVSASGPAEADFETRVLRNELHRIMQMPGNPYGNISVSDRNGQLFTDATGDALPESSSVAGQVYFEKTRKGKIVIGKAFTSGNTETLLLPVYAPVLSDGTFVGAVMATLRISEIAEQILSVRAGQTGYAFVANQDGIILIHPRSDLVMHLNISDLEGMQDIARDMITQKTGVMTYNFENTDKIAGYTPIPLTGWSVGVTQPVREFRGVIRYLKIVMSGITIFFLILAIGIAFFLSGKISHPIRRVVSGLHQSSAQIGAAAHEVSDASQVLAQSASEQAAALEEGASQLKEITGMSRQTKDLTQGGRSLMNENIQKSGHSLKALVDLTRKMNRIEADSDQVGEIIKTIDEIAFQTNLLALNAAVEAARAGEAGAGFAVVAEEVKNLASRSTDAARSTQTLLNATIRHVREAAVAIRSVNEDFGDIIESATVMGEKTEAITEASKKQNLAIEQMSHAADEMDQSTQQIAAHSEETAAAAEELFAQSQEMRGFIIELLGIIGETITRNRKMP
ncbi:hypothetical protein DENIS_0515 [Desulfonema ishimotonii]|uniref:Methyl-accepting transducer domain-containing protein n=1 Tax=Desulfonema ishimotonii TaxID=45657 RepID=A0A401FRI8_9BACT|nr:methyl-accepting chemotaxis protein [Desulfonema ishimotonii]GBC59576.1 hypothetical protein DENIS_0515 [Desulfonema ishimotonii]